jgi:rRNA maturation endonuclease Nob1
MNDSLKDLKDVITENIIREWYWYKVCEGCESVVDISDATCPICRAYRFDRSEKRVISHAFNVYDRFQEIIYSDPEQWEYND